PMTIVAGARSAYGATPPAMRWRDQRGRRREETASSLSTAATSAAPSGVTGLRAGVQDPRDRVARTRRRGPHGLASGEDRLAHLLKHVAALDVRPVRRDRHEPVVLRRPRERRDLRIPGGDSREVRGVRDVPG